LISGAAASIKADRVLDAVAMRIVGGKLKGRAIRAPEGRGTRPTSDRARESIFNVLSHADWAIPLEGARVIDAFAGSGALGLEALSRGAAFCLFVETDSAARGCIRENIETFQLFGVTRIHRRSATDLGAKPAGLGAPFDLVFMDPPYDYDLVPPALDQLVRGAWVTPDALVVAETGADESAPETKGWRLLDERIYGAARISFLRAGN
jgi:16S rRNA (guanine966-N2)-methyltransferase